MPQASAITRPRRRPLSKRPIGAPLGLLVKSPPTVISRAVCTLSHEIFGSIRCTLVLPLSARRPPTPSARLGRKAKACAPRGNACGGHIAGSSFCGNLKASVIARSPVLCIVPPVPYSPAWTGDARDCGGVLGPVEYLDP